MKIYTNNLPEGDGMGYDSLANLLHLPHKILEFHDVDGLAQIVLHELGHNGSLGLSRAGYLVDNPAFVCLRGVAGYSNEECGMHKQDMWSSPQSFADDMKNAEFNQKIATFYDRSIQRKKNDEIDPEAVKTLGHMLGLQRPSLLKWKMKHGNNGILVFEDNGMNMARRKELLHPFVALLSMC